MTSQVTHACNLPRPVQEVAEPLLDLKVGIETLQYNRTFKYILSVLLNIGNFLNDSSVSQQCV